MSETQTRTLITAAEAAATLPSPGRLSALLLEHGTMQLRWFAPKGEDTQTPHDQDELYIIASGTGWFRRGAERVAFGPHDALFVRAGEVHRFEETSADFATWVIFYGAKGGEGYGAGPHAPLCYKRALSLKDHPMELRARFTDALKTAMLAKDAATTSTMRMILAKLKDTDIAARKTPQDPGVPDDQVIAMLRGMAKSRRESVDMYRQGNRPELVAKEEAEIAVIESFLPQQMDDAAMAAAIDAAVAEAGAASIKDMGKVMAVLKSRHAAALDMAKAGPMVKARLGG